MKSDISMKKLLLCSLLVVNPAHAKGIFTEGDELLLQTSVWTKHYNPEPDHNNHQEMINLEYYFNDDVKFFVNPKQASWRDDVRWLVGGATFKNSYDQQSTYVYGGGRYDYALGENTKAYAKLTAGLLYGYRGEYKDKIPFNSLGVAPVILPAVGVQHRRVNLELVPFAAAGVMINAGFYFR
jgi:hypothetical protein